MNLGSRLTASTGPSCVAVLRLSTGSPGSPCPFCWVLRCVLAPVEVYGNVLHDEVLQEGF